MDFDFDRPQKKDFKASKPNGFFGNKNKRTTCCKSIRKRGFLEASKIHRTQGSRGRLMREQA